MNKGQRKRCKIAKYPSRTVKKKARKFVNQVIDEIESHFDLSYRRILSGYYIFDMGPSSVLHFRLSDVPLWKFGIWFQGKSATLFAEHDMYMDKFKPSACPLSVSFPKDLLKLYVPMIEQMILDSKDEYDAEDIERLIKDEALTKEINYSNNKIVKDEMSAYNKTIIDKGVKLILKDRNSKTFRISPRYVIETHTSQSMCSLDDDKLEEINDVFAEILIDKLKYNGYDTEQYVIEFSGKHSIVHAKSEEEYYENQRKYIGDPW